MDNYQRFGEKLPKLHGMKNWDCPAAIKWDELIRDITSLKDGKVITIKTRAQKKLKRPKKVTFVPTEIVVVEGYFLFYKKSLRKLLDFLVYLDASDRILTKRRTKVKGAGGRYIEKVVLPMYHKYIESAKKYADLILDTEKYSITQCCQKVIQYLDFS